VEGDDTEELAVEGDCCWEALGMVQVRSAPNSW